MIVDLDGDDGKAVQCVYLVSSFLSEHCWI